MRALLPRAAVGAPLVLLQEVGEKRLRHAFDIALLKILFERLRLGRVRWLGIVGALDPSGSPRGRDVGAFQVGGSD
ncbi:hypothetical protein [Bradyrhizobium liaoningense]|uniref:hypothetical protein n=1 Tax=Bradyrhizobium liaoningense TaxID=43992 RepID=UPI001BAA00E5|nr:hypothetical protein [Bradyrhizobium liaoningense]MBR0822689.1 hypothetical protein [Bradyrhizobium liaoningense]